MSKFPALFVVTIVALSVFFLNISAQTPATAERTRLAAEAATDFENGKDADVIEKTTRILEAAPNSPQIIALRGLAYVRLEKNDQAVADLSKAISLGLEEPLKLTARKMRGLTLRKLGRCGEAIPDFDEVIRAEKDQIPSYLFRGDCFISLGRWNEAAADFTSLISLDPEKPAWYRRRAFAFLKLKNADKAAADATDALKRKNDDVEALQFRAEAFRRLGKSDLAEADEKQRLALSPQKESEWTEESVKAKFAAAEDAEKKEEFERAVEIYTGLLAAFDEPGDTKAMLYALRGRAYYESDEFVASISDLSRAISMKSDEPAFYVFRGEALLAKKDSKASIVDFDKALSLDPKGILALRRRGQAKIDLAEYKAAIADLTAVLTLDKEFTSAYFMRSKAKRLDNDFKGALVDIGEYLAREAAEPIGYRERALTLRALGRVREAEADEKKATELESAAKK